MSDLRPSFQERDKYLTLLGKHYADGRLDEVEFEKRSDAVLKSVTHRDAMLQFEGLPKPNIVPVQGYEPPPQPRYQPQPYQKLPAPVEEPDGGGIDRRVFLVAGGIGLGVVGLIAWANNSAVVYNGPVEGVASEMVFEEGPFIDLHSAVWNVVAMLEERGLDHIASFAITDTTLSGTALALRSPGVVSTFQADLTTGEWPEILSVGEGEASNTMPMHELVDGVQQTFDRARGELTHYSENEWRFELQWANGQPVYRWTAGESYAVFNSMLDLIELKR